MDRTITESFAYSSVIHTQSDGHIQTNIHRQSDRHTQAYIVRHTVRRTYTVSHTRERGNVIMNVNISTVHGDSRFYVSMQFFVSKH